MSIKANSAPKARSFNIPTKTGKRLCKTCNGVDRIGHGAPCDDCIDGYVEEKATPEEQKKRS